MDLVLDLLLFLDFFLDSFLVLERSLLLERSLVLEGSSWFLVLEVSLVLEWSLVLDLSLVDLERGLDKDLDLDLLETILGPLTGDGDLDFVTGIYSGLFSISSRFSVQVNLCQKLLFLHQLTHNMYDNRLFIELQVQYLHENSTLKPGENMLCTEIVSDIQNNFCTQHVLPMFCRKKIF